MRTHYGSAAETPKRRWEASVYWFTKAGGDTYFGSVDAVPYSEAKKLFNDHVKILGENDVARHVERTSVPLKALNENELITRKEIEAVFAAAEMDDRPSVAGPSFSPSKLR